MEATLGLDWECSKSKPPLPRPTRVAACSPPKASSTPESGGGSFIWILFIYLCIYVFIYLFKIPPRDNRSDIHQSPQTQEGDQLPCPTSLFRLCWKGPDTLGCREEGKGKPLEGPYSLFPLRIVSLNLQKSRESSVVAAAGFFLIC